MQAPPPLLLLLLWVSCFTTTCSALELRLASSSHGYRSLRQAAAALPPSPELYGHEELVGVASASEVDVDGYYAEVEVGTPPQKLSLLLDTASDLTWTRCSSSSSSSSIPSSSAIATTFHPNLSSSLTPLPCFSIACQFISSPPFCRNLITNLCYYNQSYSGHSSTAGYLFYDTLTLRLPLPHLAMGCSTTTIHPLPLSGILGLGQGPLSFISQTQDSFNHKFSYCLPPLNSPTSTSFLRLGDSSQLSSSLQFTPLLNNTFLQTFYYVAIEELRIDGSPLDIAVDEWQIDSAGNGGTIVDTGSTITLLPEMAYETLLIAFESSISYPRSKPTNGLELCYNVTDIPHPRFPHFAIAFAGNATFEPPQENYFIDVPTKNIKCLGIQSTTGMSIIGNLLQQNFYMEIDRLKKLLGFLHTDCSTSDS